MFYARNVAAGANTVTATFAKVIRASATVHVHEYSGVDRAARPGRDGGGRRIGHNAELGDCDNHKRRRPPVRDRRLDGDGDSGLGLGGRPAQLPRAT